VGYKNVILYSLVMLHT